LRAHQREDFKLAIRNTCRQHSPYRASFARLAVLENDEKTRVFLVLEIGAGHSETKALSDALTPHIRALYQEPYYEAPRFHVSIAWALLRRGELANPQVAENLSKSPSLRTFPTITELPETLLNDLDSHYGERIRTAGQFEVDAVEVKVGKEVTHCPLR